MTRPNFKKKKRLSLLTRFSLLSFLIIAVIALFIAWGLQRYLEQNIMRQEAASAADQVAGLLNHNLLSADMTGLKLEPARYEEIDNLVRQHLSHDHVVRINVWNASGQVIYSDAGETIGRIYPVTEERIAALDGQVVSGVTTLEEEEHAGEREQYGELLEVYAPIQPHDSGEIEGVYEISHDLEVVRPVIRTMRIYVFGGLGLGSLVLFGLLYTLVRNASGELIHRSNENERLYLEEETRRRELSSLYDIAKAMADAKPEVGATLDLVVRHAVQAVHTTFASILLQEDDDFVLKACYPRRKPSSGSQKGERIPARDLEHCLKALQEKDSLMFCSDDDIETSAKGRRALFLDDMARNVLIVSMNSGSKLLGLLILGEQRHETRESFTENKLRLVHGISDQAVSALLRAKLFDELESTYLATVMSLANAVEAKDAYTKSHVDNVSAMAVMIGRELNLSESELVDLHYGAVLHDVGKIGVPDNILNKPSKLNDEEWELMRAHPAAGSNILKPIPRLTGASDIVRHHHERYDGGGYPDGLAGDAILVGARILATVDSYSAMVDRRSYKSALSHEEAAAELRRCAGTQFDPNVVDVFMDLFDRGVLVPDEYEARIIAPTADDNGRHQNDDESHDHR